MCSINLSVFHGKNIYQLMLPSHILLKYIMCNESDYKIRT